MTIRSRLRSYLIREIVSDVNDFLFASLVDIRTWTGPWIEHIYNRYMFWSHLDSYSAIVFADGTAVDVNDDKVGQNSDHFGLNSYYVDGERLLIIYWQGVIHEYDGHHKMIKWPVPNGFHTCFLTPSVVCMVQPTSVTVYDFVKGHYIYRIHLSYPEIFRYRICVDRKEQMLFVLRQDMMNSYSQIEISTYSLVL
jgi:hypothetical protein